MRNILFILMGLGLSGTLQAGVFNGVVNCNNPQSENFCAQGMTDAVNDEDEVMINARGIMHPLGFTGSPTVDVLTIPICVSPDSSDLIGPTQRAIAMWNDLIPMTGQCRHCFTHEEGSGPPKDSDRFFAETVVLHELGHCAMGLDHPDLRFDPPGDPDAREPTSFTMSYNGSSMGVDDGPDDIRGSFDDTQVAAGGMLPDAVHWFRRTDNNPVVVDDTPIDINTYRRSIGNLPEKHGWAANGNRVVAESLGFPETQAVMYSSGGPFQRFAGLTADDVNMVKMGMTGLDFMAGTEDDYTISLVYVDDCSAADIEVTFSADASGLGRCLLWKNLIIPSQNPVTASHYSITKIFSLPRLLVQLNPSVTWDFSEEVFYDGFESGNTSEWTSSLP